METKIEREEIEIKKNTNVRVLQETFEANGWELESVRVQNKKMLATFIKRS